MTRFNVAPTPPFGISLGTIAAKPVCHRCHRCHRQNGTSYSFYNFLVLVFSKLL